MELKIKNNLEKFEYRTKIKKQVKIIKIDDNSNLVNSKKIGRYEYYVCDYCGEEIKVTNKIDERTGGIVTIPQYITGERPIKLILCNKCLNPVIKELQGR